MAKKHDLEPIDIYGNWRVRTLRIQRSIDHGLKVGMSKFRIRNKASRHVLVKKAHVAWNGRANEIPLQVVKRTGKDRANYAAGRRLKASVTSPTQRLTVFFGSPDDGKSLRFQVEKRLPQGAGTPGAGNFGTAGRGG
jgi:hypothetical protein